MHSNDELRGTKWPCPTGIINVTSLLFLSTTFSWVILNFGFCLFCNSGKIVRNHFVFRSGIISDFYVKLETRARRKFAVDVRDRIVQLNWEGQSGKYIVHVIGCSKWTVTKRLKLYSETNNNDWSYGRGGKPTITPSDRPIHCATLRSE